MPLHSLKHGYDIHNSTTFILKKDKASTGRKIKLYKNQVNELLERDDWERDELLERDDWDIVLKKKLSWIYDETFAEVIQQTVQQESTIKLK